MDLWILVNPICCCFHYYHHHYYYYYFSPLPSTHVRVLLNCMEVGHWWMACPFCLQVLFPLLKCHPGAAVVVVFKIASIVYFFLISHYIHLPVPLTYICSSNSSSRSRSHWCNLVLVASAMTCQSLVLPSTSSHLSASILLLSLDPHTPPLLPTRFCPHMCLQ